MKHTIRKTTDEVLYLSKQPRRFAKYKNGTCTFSDFTLCVGTEDGFFYSAKDDGFGKLVGMELLEGDRAIGEVKRDLAYGVYGDFYSDYSSRTGIELPILPRRDAPYGGKVEVISANSDEMIEAMCYGDGLRDVFTLLPSNEQWTTRPCSGDAVTTHGHLIGFVVGVTNDHCFCITAERLVKELRQTIRYDNR